MFKNISNKNTYEKSFHLKNTIMNECVQMKSNDLGFVNGAPILFQFIFAFTIGFIVSPLSFGLLLLLVFIVIFEAYFILSVGGHHWKPWRGAIIGAYIFGFIIGRIVFGDNDPIRCTYDEYPHRHRYRKRRYHKQE